MFNPDAYSECEKRMGRRDASEPPAPIPPHEHGTLLCPPCANREHGIAGTCWHGICECESCNPFNVVDYLIFCSYKHNRQTSPQVTPEQWKAIFGAATEKLEAQYQREIFQRLASATEPHFTRMEESERDYSANTR